MRTQPTPVKMLKEDHRKVKELFKDFEDAEDSEQRRQIALEAVLDLKVHDKIESEIFYPAVEGDVDDEELMAEAREEHHVVRQLVSELEEEGLEDLAFNAKFAVLAESVRRHIKEEEGKIFSKAEKSEMDMEELAQRMSQRKQELQEEIGQAAASRS